MTLQDLVKLPIEEIIRRSDFVRLERENMMSESYWRIDMKAVFDPNGAGETSYTFLTNPSAFPLVRIYKVIE